MVVLRQELPLPWWFLNMSSKFKQQPWVFGGGSMNPKVLFLQLQQDRPRESFQKGSSFHPFLAFLHDPALPKGNRSEPIVTGPSIPKACLASPCHHWDQALHSLSE